MSLEQKTWQVYSDYCFGKRDVFKSDLNESRECLFHRRRRRSLQVEGLEREKVQAPTAENLIRGIWKLIISEAEWRVLEGLHVYNICVHKQKRYQAQHFWNTYN